MNKRAVLVGFTEHWRYFHALCYVQWL